MKNTLMLLLVIWFAGAIYAQDIIVKKDGSIIKAKVLELTETSVLYKNHANLDGPTYSLKIENILSLTYENGVQESFSNFTASTDVSNSKDQTSSTDMSDAILLSRIADLESKADHIKTIGTWVGVTGILGIIVADVLIFGDNLGIALAIGVPVMLIYMWGEISLFNSFANSYTSQADKLRSQLKNKGSLSLAPSLLRNNIDRGLGSGIALSIRF